MTRGRGRHSLTLLALAASFVAGVLFDGWLRTYGPPQPVQMAVGPQKAPVPDRQAAVAPSLPRAVQRAGPVDQLTLTPGPVPASTPPPGPGPAPAETAREESGGIGADAISPTLLRLPIDGITLDSLEHGFSELRGKRPHEAVDIVVPRGTPVHAVQDGTIAKLFHSLAGGITIYQWDINGRLCYYYAHLDHYADGLREGQRVSQGEVIGYVGTSGNAPPDTPHLHFAIFEATADRTWWQGRPLDPYRMFKNKTQD